MCQYFSCIITKDLKVHWSKKTTAHEEVLSELKIEDKKLENREFVRIEISPNDKTKMTRDPKDWKLKIDEEETLPEWFVENQKKAEKTCWKVWEESIQIQLGLNDENKGALTDTLVFLYGSSSAVLYGSSSAELYGSSSAELNGSSRAVLYDSSSAELKTKTSVAISHGKIFVHTEATIIKTSEVKAEDV